MTGIGDHRRSQVGGHVVQTRRRRHAAGRAVAARPVAAQPPVGAEVFVEPAVAERRGDPFGLAPLQQGVDQRVSSGDRLQPPRPGVGQFDADAAQQRLDLCRIAQVVACVRRVLQHLCIACSSLLGGLGLAARPRADEAGDDLLGGTPIHRQPVGRQFGAQQLGCRLRPGRRSRPGTVREVDQPRFLANGDLCGELRPATQPLRRPGKLGFQPLRLEVSVGPQRLVGWPGLRCIGEQIDGFDSRQAVDVQVVKHRPHSVRIRTPPAGEQTVHRGDVPALGHPYTSVRPATSPPGPTSPSAAGRPLRYRAPLRPGSRWPPTATTHRASPPPTRLPAPWPAARKPPRSKPAVRSSSTMS